MPSCLRPTARGLVPALLASFLLAGCVSDDTSGGPTGKGPSHKAPAPAVAGQETFFDGKVTAEVKVGALAGFDRSGDGSASGGPGGHRRRGGFSMGGMGVAGASGLGPGGDMGGPPPGGEGGPAAMPRGRPSSPPVMIHLRLINHGTEKIEVVIADFLSPLGNFVTFPSKLTLEPGQSVEVEPMTSRLAGDVAGGEITLRLRLGDRQETKAITLKPETPAAPKS